MSDINKVTIGVLVIALIALSFLVVVIRKENAVVNDCAAKHPHNRTRIINNICHYSSEFGWIKTSKIVVRPEQYKGIK